MTDVRNKNGMNYSAVLMNGMANSITVYSKPLHQHSSTEPKTGVLRDGFCRVPPEDSGNHSVAGIITEQFLDFTAAQGNDLRKQVGLKGGQKWCLCASRWKQAFDARDGPQDSKVPRVMLHATNEKALDVVGFKDLKAFAGEPKANNASKSPQPPLDHPESRFKPGQPGGKEPKA